MVFYYWLNLLIISSSLRLVPHLMTEGDTVYESSFAIVPWMTKEIPRRHFGGDSLSTYPKGASISLPFDRLLDDRSLTDFNQEKWKSIDRTLSKIVQVFSSQLFANNEKYFRVCTDIRFSIRILNRNLNPLKNDYLQASGCICDFFVCFWVRNYNQNNENPLAPEVTHLLQV